MKYLKGIGIAVVLFVVLGFVAVKVMSEPLPEGVSGASAEALAMEVLDAVGNDSFDSTVWVSWTFPGGHDYVWHVPTNQAQISYGDVVVTMQLDSRSGTAANAGVPLEGEGLQDALAKAWSIWCNDSWWLIAPHKVMDRGASRSLVDVSEQYPGHRGLLVQYETGGVTPGDAYLWIVDGAGLPVGYKMWVKILPIKGLYASWDEYKALHSGALVSTLHDLGIIETGLSPVRSGTSYTDIGLSADPFTSG